MDLGIVLAIVGIGLTIIFGLLPFIIKSDNIGNNNIVGNHGSKNKFNVKDSFNNKNSFNSKVYVDNKTIINNTYNANSSHTQGSNSGEDALSNMLVFIFLAFLVMAIVVATYVIYQKLIITVVAALAILGVLISLFVAVYKSSSLQNWHKAFIILSWLPVFILIVALKIPFFPPTSLTAVIEGISSGGYTGIVGRFYNYFNSNRNEIMFLILQIIGLIPLLLIIIMNFYYSYKNIKEDDAYCKSFKTHVSFVIFMTIIGFVLISGIVAKIAEYFSI